MNAAFMDADIFYSGMSGPTTYKNAICVFEHSPSKPSLLRVPTRNRPAALSKPPCARSLETVSESNAANCR
jgi:hypothetical protein